MTKRFLFLALTLNLWSAARLYADVWDLTDPSHPVALSTGSPVNDEESPSYDCAKARTATEKLICGNEQLAANDRQLATLYQALKMCLPAGEMANIRAAQKKWLASRASCASTINDPDDAVNRASILCLQNAFHKRIDDLMKLNHQCVDVSIASSPAAWKTYRDERYKFSISFPQTLDTSAEFIGHYHVLGDVWRQHFQNSEHPDDHGIPVISIIIDRPNGDHSYPDTEIRIGVHAGKSVQEACGTQAGDSERTQTINGQALRIGSLGRRHDAICDGHQLSIIP